ncbi:MAG: crotonobetainyl-CoA:carnitine CoA-transferase CaiB-like acyl-CoA transferase [Acidimicrobiales bacterium]|jgi:crotonobetainyl-CoA:carnitine CoA-transferase CaiB-like acyl-CoA transferase
MLSPYRVLDLSDERGHLCGQMLAALGAEVIAIEPPSGSRARHIGPFIDGIDDGEHSLTHFSYNRGKKSVVLNFDLLEERERLFHLIAASDVLIESDRPGRMAELGLGYEQVAEEFPHLVYVSISAFGQTGPKAHWAATDLTVMASACTMSVTGDEDRPPVRVTVPQGFHFGAATSVSGVIAALIERDHSGEGQHIDAAAQRTATLATQAGVLSTGVGSIDASRTAGGAVTGAIRLRLVYPAADGFVSITHVFGMPIGQNTRWLMDWVCEAGFCDEAMRDKDWVGYLVALENGTEPIAEWEAAKAAVAAFTSSKTKAELLAGAMERRLLMAPIATPADVVASEQLAERGFLEEVEHPVAGKLLTVPGAFAKCSATPLRPLGPAPTLGQHNDAILGKGRLWPRLDLIPQTGSLRPDLDPAGDLPLSGLKVLDFTWSIAGPHAVRVLADLGATVVKVESASKQDAARGYRPVHNDEAGIENSALFDTMAAGKRSLALDMSKPGAIEVVHDLVAWADVVAESFSPRAMPKWGLDYESLRKINPEIIMVSTCLAGQTGPLANFAGYGNLGAALAGFYGLAGWPDRAPAGPFGAYSDYTSTHFLAATMLAAIDHRRRTGEGQYIDLAQSEAAQHFLSPALLEVTANNRVMERDGNRDPHMVPHGVYPSAEDDSWIAIACEDDAQWRALASMMGRDDLLSDSGLGSLAGRLARVDELDAAVATWSEQFENTQLDQKLQEVGVAAHAVLTGAGCLADSQFAHAGHFLRPDHPDRGCLIENTRFRMSRTATNVNTRAPFLGEHTFEILTNVLGYNNDRIAQLAAAEILE